jgi:hypothetical protein
MTLNKFNKKVTLPLKKEKFLHIPWSEIYSYFSNTNINIIYDNVKLEAVSFRINNYKRAILFPDAYGKRVKVFNSNSFSDMYIYIYILFMVLLILSVCVICSSIDEFSESNNLINHTIDFSVKSSNKTDIRSWLNTINRSIPNVGKVNQVDSIFIQCKQHCIDNKYNESVILNKVKALHLGEIVTECNTYKDKVSELEMQINKNKAANSRLVTDINEILREMEYERKKS